MINRYLAIKDFSSITRLINIDDIKNDVDIYNTIITEICENNKDIIKFYGSNIYLSYNGKPIHQNTLKKIQFTDNINNIEWYTRVKGGFIKDVINFVVGLARMFLFIPKFLIWLGGFVVWIIRATYFLIAVALRYIYNDGIIGLVKFLAFEIIMAPITFVMTMLKIFVNWIGRNTVQALWGADNVPEPGEPSDKLINECSGQKCYKTAEGTIPFSVIITTILCPPVGIFMEYGITGWFNILITALLTLIFYFPGLIYALILLYC